MTCVTRLYWNLCMNQLHPCWTLGMCKWRMVQRTKVTVCMLAFSVSPQLMLTPVQTNVHTSVQPGTEPVLISEFLGHDIGDAITPHHGPCVVGTPVVTTCTNRLKNFLHPTVGVWIGHDRLPHCNSVVVCHLFGILNGGGIPFTQHRIHNHMLPCTETIILQHKPSLYLRVCRVTMI